MTGDIIAYLEVRDGAVKKSAREVVTAARSIASPLGARVVGLALADGQVTGLEELGKYGADELLHASGDAFSRYAPANFARAIQELAEQRGARAILLSASAVGKDLAPRVSGMMKIPQVSDCVGLRVEEGRIVARRPVYAGKARWTVRATGECVIATLRPNVFTPAEADGKDAVAPQPFTPSGLADDPRVVLKEVIESDGGKVIELTEADIIVSGGRGMKGPENYAILEELASVLGAAVGASRAAVDAGWRPHRDQVGQTGKTVSPNLYIACGISGAIQHLAGMSSSRVIVAINKDPEAPIFKVANYGIVGDLFEVVPALTEEIRKLRQGS